ncbi:MAG: dihydropteroate synthase [Chloroflexi bacterium]|nr:dihydropteroate synthase [Chloroflexota bacterium]
MEKGSLTIGSRTFRWGEKTYVMGILNLTPDSFSGDGLVGNVQLAVERALQMAAEGADIIDIGGESTRPGSQPISVDEELSRVMPVIEALTGRLSCPISIDTYKSRVAEKALDAGAAMINDVWGLRMDPGLADLATERKVPIVLMHNRSQPKDAVQSQRLGGRYLGVEYKDLLGEISQELQASITQAIKAGVEGARIIIDPGIGFGKTVEQNLELIRRLPQLQILGYPILVGPSRKSFIGYTLDLPVEERLEGTAASLALAIGGGADMVRVHDVKEMARVVKMADAIVRRPITTSAVG